MKGCSESRSDTAGQQGYLSFPQASGSTKPQLVAFDFLRPLKPTLVFATYWRFAAERQNIFFRRIRNEPPPWTEDLVLREHKFTNAYRSSDSVGQYLIRHVIYQGEQSPLEACFRILLFKFFNRIETW